jgi:two-component system, NtrC family, sensor histidine kinase PilS
MVGLSPAISENVDAAKRRRFGLLTWLRFGVSILLALSLTLMHGAGNKESNVLSPALVANAYALASLVGLWLLYYSQVNWFNQLFGQLLIDVILIALLVTTLGGGSGGYAILFMIPIAASASLMNRTSAMFICSVSVIALLVDGVRRALMVNVEVDWVLLGVLGLAGFGLMAILRFAAERTERIEMLAVQAQIKTQLMQEITEQHTSEDQLGWVVLDASNTVQLLNSPARALAWQAGELLEIGYTIDEKSGLNVWLSALNKTNEQTLVWPALTQSGTLLPPPLTALIHIKAAPLPQLKGYTALTLELDEARSARNRHEQLAILGRLSASIAHEIRNPLASISQASELLKESSEQDTSGAPLLEIILSNAQRIDRIVHNLLAGSRGVKAMPMSFRAHEVVVQMVHDISLGLHLNAEQVLIKPSDLGLMEVCFDKDHLYQILSNLLSNAAYFCTGLSHSICVQLRPRGRFVALVIMDDGPAVDAHVARHLFEPFQTASKKGTGLGLYLCREYAQANHGTLQLTELDASAPTMQSWIQAPYTKGFVLSLPVGELESPTLKPLT